MALVTLNHFAASSEFPHGAGQAPFIPVLLFGGTGEY